MRDRTVYLNFEKDGKVIKADSLQEAIEQIPEVTTVVLFWTWSEEFYTSNASLFEAYVCPSVIDEEYSFFGDREDALEFAGNYNCWDGDDFLLLPISDGFLLYGYHDEFDNQRSWNDHSDWVNGLSEGYDPSWFGFLRVDTDHTGTEYLLSPGPIPDSMKEAKE